MTLDALEQSHRTIGGSSAASQIQNYKFEFCNVHDDYVETEKQYFCKNCMQYLCAECYENRKKHECILIEEDVL
jgi:hypothetical protein